MQGRQAGGPILSRARVESPARGTGLSLGDPDRGLPARARPRRAHARERSRAPSGGGTRSGTGRHGPRRRSRQPVSRQRDVDLVREPVERRRPGADRPQGAPPPDPHGLHQELRRGRRMEPVQPTAWCPPSTPAGCAFAPGSSSTATIPSAEAKRGAQAVTQGSRLPGDRRRVALRGSLRGGRQVRRQAPPPDRRQVPHRPGQLPLRRLPPRVFPYSVFLGTGGARFNLPQVYWHAIGVAVGAGRTSTPSSSTASTGGPSHPLGQTYANPPIRQIQRFRRMAITYGSRASAGGTGRRRARRSGGPSGKRIDKGVSGVRRPHELPDPRQGQPRRPRGLGAGAPQGRRQVAAGERRLQPRHGAGREGLPALQEALRRRQDRRRRPGAGCSPRSRRWSTGRAGRAARPVLRPPPRARPRCRPFATRSRRLPTADEVAPPGTGYDRAGEPIVARIESYSPGHVVVDGVELNRDVIVLPNRVLPNWWRRDGHSLVIEDLEDVLDELPERLIVGCGYAGPAGARSLGDRGAREAGRQGRGAADRRRGGPLRVSSRPETPPWSPRRST